jgi:hypothetical protein
MSEFVMLDLTTPAGAAPPAIASAALPAALPAALTIREAENIQSRLLDLVREQEAVVVDCSAATEIDLSFVQLVLSARKSAVALGKRLTVLPPASGLLSDVLRRAGIVPSTGEPPPTDLSFWGN